MMSSVSRRLAQGAVRGLHTRRVAKSGTPISQSLLDNLPKQNKEIPNETEPEDPNYYHRNPVTSAHAIDVAKGEVSKLDSVALDPSGSVVHGRYGDLGDAAAAIPLEYLALLKPAAEGVAALRVATEKASGPGTVLVFGATQANGMAATQLATASGHAVVAVVGADHSCNEDMVEYMKGMIPEPGTAVAEEYAIAKKNFSDLVDGIANGDEGLSCYSAEEMLEEFKENLLNYVEMYPEDMPAAVDPSSLKFLGMEKDKDQFRTNMEAYLAQYPPGAPAIDKQQLESNFTSEQYEVFRNKFWEQTTSVISGDESHYFSPPHIVKDLMKSPEQLDRKTFEQGAAKIPFSFTPNKGFHPEGTVAPAGGKVAGAVIAVTPDLETAAKAVDAAKTLREKAEALQFLSNAQKSAFSAACSVAAQAKKAGAPVVAVGGGL